MPATAGGQAADEAARRFVLRGAEHRAPRPEPGLYLVATPIGNLSDVSVRALETIAGADRLACEDTRVTGKLLARFAIERRMSAYHEHNAAEAGEKLLADLEAGRSVALVSDAGTPLVSDPGYRLVQDALDRGIRVIPIPGASAVIAALLASGLPSDAFFFAGFLPQKEQARARRLEELIRIPGTLLLFEAPHRIAASLAAMAQVLGERPAAVCRELTKLHETVYRGTLPELAAEFSAMEEVRGEIVVCIAPPEAEAVAAPEDADAILSGLLGEMKPAKAAQEAARLTGLARRDLYQRALALKDRG
ncbi:16S rRNA (cytidine(1402)-2'-O)-methyltransferase [Aurantimonas sp. VKM B-3413]|uniref:16S rRNA (cytidine(1402)-2'-O)-methyltransferase n=1 Tax=Aurantimonas sp. VKM B-3413 TaxID=2779401 RepID=UPI001E29E875|nr:16S rRNA (cytidine(1402)-2'-O)-methyltransferase [Aurantimonas sp. VKM B-3413]MCB8840764.1 16S rRNA (cytidine(1402)-2'-O)-methyltransferase [Aurantimonas sp. VKM B-3413]